MPRKIFNYLTEDEIANDYITLSSEDKDIILDKIIDSSIKLIDGALSFNPEIDRINFLINTLNESLEINEELERYEICQMIKDILIRIDES